MKRVFPTFSEFFQAVVGYEPHEWQIELSDRVRDGEWPARVEVPTGLGKTATILVAVYELARQLHHSLPRTAPQRIFHVVNRRTLVEDVGGLIKRLAEAVNNCHQDSPVRLVRDALSRLLGPGNAVPVTTGVIHGESPKGASWLRATGCSIVTLTPPQFVSRLVMRGFAVAPGRRPIDAALVGVDRLVLFDEPHLAIQAVQTTLDAERLQAQARESLGIPLGCTVLLGATLPSALTDIMDRNSSIRLDSSTLDPSLARASTPSLAAKLLHAPKRIHLERVDNCKDATFVAAMAKHAIAAAAEGQPVAVFANTVPLAQLIYQQIASDPTAPVRLVTSRFRPLDRSRLDIATGITVTTQCLEVGVDVSFGAVITEVAPWDALVQRFGRLNRRAELERAEAYVVMAKSGAVRDGTTYVYGERPVCAAMDLLDLAETESPGGIGASPAALLALRRRGDARQLDGDLPRVATLHAGLLPVMTQTWPTPAPDIPVDALVAGPDVPVNRDIDIAWREHLAALDNSTSAGDVYAAESVAVPRAALACFLRGQAGGRNQAPVADVVDPVFGEKATLGPVPSETLAAIRLWDNTAERWRPPSSLDDVLRTERVVLWTALGGYRDDLGWTGAPGHVADLHIVAALSRWGDPDGVRGRRRASLSLSKLTAEPVLQRASDVLQFRIVDRDAPNPASSTDGSALDELWALLTEFATVKNQELDLVITAIQGQLPQLLPQLFVEAARRQVPGVVVRIDSIEVPPDRPDARNIQCAISLPRQRSDAATAEVTLRDHLTQVGDWVEQDACAAGVTGALVAALGTAGRWHDVGKVFPPFQKLLCGCSDAEVTATGVLWPDGELRPYLAKSPSGVAVDINSLRPVDQTARKAAGLPQGFRHEAASELAYRTVHGDPLPGHLAGSHHGRCRPLVPPLPGVQTAGYRHADDFAALNEKFGPWGLAYLEATLRLADWRASALPEKPPTSDVVDGILRAVDPSQWQATLSRQDRTAVVDARMHVFSGLCSHILTGWFASFGLLAAAVDAGDEAATLFWRGTGTAPNVPVLTTQLPLPDLVASLFAPELWAKADVLIARTLGGAKMKLGRKNQKLAPAAGLRQVLLSAEADPELRPLLGLLGDLGSADGTGQVDMPIAPIANNSSYPGLALAALARSGAIAECLAALTDMNRGFSQSACDGGMDRPRAAMPLVNGIGAPRNQRSVRAALAPLALYGMGRLGNAGARPLGVAPAGRSLALHLPLPTEPSTLAELTSMTIGVRSPRSWIWSAIGCEWIYAATREKLTHRDDVDIVWSGAVVRRSEV